MPLDLSRAQWIELFRYYRTGLLNLAFGLGCYMVLVCAGMNIYAAQLISHLMGMTFNYFTYSRHVFRGAEPAKARFILSYAANYGVNLAVLAVVAQFVRSPYAAGIITALIASVVNYFALKFFVFRKRAA